MKVLVTGGTGFIGSHLVENLIKEGHEVTCLVRDVKRAKHVLGDVQLIEGDVTQRESLNELKREAHNFDVVFHLAALIDPPNIPYSRYYKVNVEGTKNIAECFLNTNISRFVYFSSIAAVGLHKATNVINPINEYVICEPDTAYGKSKLEAEKVLQKYKEEFGLPIVILRPTTVYGPREKYNVLELCRAIKKGIFRYIGSGENFWSFTYVDNVVSAAILVAKSKLAEGNTYFVSDERPYRVKEIVEAFSRAMGVPPPRSHLPVRLAMAISLPFELFGFLTRSRPLLSRSRVRTLIMNYVYDISRLRALGYRQVVSLEEGARRTVQWYQENKLL